MITLLRRFLRRTGLLGDLARLAAWAVVALVLALGLNAVSRARLPLWPAPGQPAALPVASAAKIKFAEAATVNAAQGEVLLDVREARDYARAHPPGAVNLPYREFNRVFPDFRDRFDPRHPVHIYCYGNACGTSLRVANRLLQHGFTDVTVVRGGFEAWKARGLPIEEGGAGRV